MKPAKIQRISTEQLEAILRPHAEHGLLHTKYNAGNSAFEYRLPNQALLAVTVGPHHFCEMARVKLVEVRV